MIRGGWPIVLTSVFSTLAAVGYMGGPRPIAYTPFGELTVFVFFGLVAVCGTYYVQAGTIGAAAWIAAVAIGMHAAAVLLVNNYRDCAHDAATGRRTLAVVLGAAAAVRLYALLVLCAVRAALARAAAGRRRPLVRVAAAGGAVGVAAAARPRANARAARRRTRCSFAR